MPETTPASNNVRCRRVPGVMAYTNQRLAVEAAAHTRSRVAARPRGVLKR